MKLLALSLVLLLHVAPLFAKGPDVSRSVDWEKRVILFTLTGAVDASALPASKQRTENLIDRTKGRAIIENMMDFPLNALGTIADQGAGDLAIDMERAASMAKKEYATLSSDMREVSVRYSLSFADLLAEGILRGSVVPITPVLGYVAPFDYSGIVVYAADPLPIAGRDQDRLVNVTPALLSSVRTVDGEPLASDRIEDPAFLKKWGPVGFTESSQARDWPVDRVGLNPYVIAAGAIYGATAHDVIVSSQASRAILSSETGRKLLREGRVLIVVAGRPDAVPENQR